MNEPTTVPLPSPFTLQRLPQHILLNPIYPQNHSHLYSIYIFLFISLDSSHTTSLAYMYLKVNLPHHYRTFHITHVTFYLYKHVPFHFFKMHLYTIPFLPLFSSYYLLSFHMQGGFLLISLKLGNQQR